MAVFPVILDSCVLYPMYLRDTLLCAAEAQLYRVQWSQKIIDDALENLVKDGRITPKQKQKLETCIKTAFPEALIEVTERLIPCMDNHEGDRHVLAAALIAKADVIVTNNLKHFPRYSLEKYNVEAQSPDVFLTSLFDLYPEEMCKVLQNQVKGKKNPPLTVPKLLTLLEKQTPLFVERCRQGFL